VTELPGLEDDLTNILDQLVASVDGISSALPSIEPPAGEAGAKLTASVTRSSPLTGEDVTSAVMIPSSLARGGGRTVVHVRVLERCPRCEGSGGIRNDEGLSGKCGSCDGTGRIQNERRLSVQLPAGLKSGVQLRVASEGNASRTDGPPGDLLLSVFVKPRRRAPRFFGFAAFSFLILGPRC